MAPFETFMVTPPPFGEEFFVPERLIQPSQPSVRPTADNARTQPVTLPVTKSTVASPATVPFPVGNPEFMLPNLIQPMFGDQA